jgi:cytochrome b6-f complex iron-sulfur subunit
MKNKKISQENQEQVLVQPAQKSRWNRRSGAHQEGPSQLAENLSRRNFLKIGLVGLSAVAGFEIGSVGLMYMRSRSLEGEFGGVITAGEVNNFPPGSVTEFPKDGFFLVRYEDGSFRALYRRCPHLGCTVDWVPDEERFYCPCHGSSFDKTGNFDSPPVPRALDTFPIDIQDTLVMVDTSRMVRSGDEPQKISQPE